MRKTVSLEESLWQQISDYRFDARIKSESEAVRRVIEAGLRALKKKAPSR